MNSDLCDLYIKSLGLTASGFDYLIAKLDTRFCALWQQTPSEPLVIPYITKQMQMLLLSTKTIWNMQSVGFQSLLNKIEQYFLLTFEKFHTYKLQSIDHKNIEIFI